MKTKVLFLVSTLEDLGPTNVVYNIIKYLDRDCIDPEILTMSPEPPRSKINDFLSLGVQVHQANNSRLSWMLSGGKNLIKLIRSINPQIIHGHSLRPDLLSAGFLDDFYTISTIHSDLYINYRDSYNYIIGTYFANQHLNALKKIDRPVSCSRSVYRIYRDLFPSLIAIPNGVDSEIFTPASSEVKLRLRIELSVPVDKKVFVSVGSLIKRKDPITVIEGFLKSNVANDSILIILGVGKLDNYLRTKYERFPNVIFEGFKSNVVQFLQLADFFISASISEGLPNTVMEALACGLPVCLSQIASHNEILAIDKGAGFSFPCGNPVELGKGIDNIMKKPYNQLQDAAINIISCELNAKKMSSQYQSLYLKLI